MTLPIQLGVDVILGFLEAFGVGVVTALTAGCALPLYPGFVSYLARTDAATPAESGTANTLSGSGTNEQGTSMNAVPDASRTGDGVPATESATDSTRRSSLALGVAVVAGVVAFMGVIGVVFAYALEVSLTVVVEVVSPVAFVVLLVLGFLLVLDHDVVHRIPGLDPPETGNAYLSAFAYGAFFGGIVLPCNPGFIALFFARTPILFETPLQGFVGFLLFGLGLGTPLLVLAALSEASGRRITRTLASHSSAVNRVAGVLMVAIAMYYLLKVFDVLGFASAIPF